MFVARRTAIGILAAGAASVAVSIPSPAPIRGLPRDCSAANLATTISSVTSQLSTYFKAHPDVNQALIDATRQSAFVAIGHSTPTSTTTRSRPTTSVPSPPLHDFQNHCGLRV